MYEGNPYDGAMTGIPSPNKGHPAQHMFAYPQQGYGYVGDVSHNSGRKPLDHARPIMGAPAF